MTAPGQPSIFDFARWYDVSINWTARLQRELPLLCETFEPPGDNGLLDAGCGPGHHLVALASAGYKLTGVDCSPEMLAIARQRIDQAGANAALIESRFENLDPACGRFDGVYCLGNSLAVAADADVARRSFAGLAAVLVPGGRLFIQLLNFEKLRNESPPVRGPRIHTADGVEYISTRVYGFNGDQIAITNVTHYNQNGWKQFAKTGHLYAITQRQVHDWCAQHGLRVDHDHADYQRRPFDPATASDLIVIATRTTG